MRAKISLSFFFIVILEAQLAQAQPTTCPRDLRWSDATYIQRTTRIGGHVSKANFEKFSNATFVRFEFDGVPKAVVIRLKGREHVDDIYLTSGSDRPRPSDFSEIGMVLDLPMSDGTWPRLSNPCAPEDGVSVHFDETDMPSDAGKSTKFHGTLTRSGLRITYVMTAQVEDDKASDGVPMALEGTWKYTRELEEISSEIDVQGWHLYRADVYLKTLPVGAPISLATALKQAAIKGPHTFK